jgi:hypothetical protein
MTEFNIEILIKISIITFKWFDKCIFFSVELIVYAFLFHLIFVKTVFNEIIVEKHLLLWEIIDKNLYKIKWIF